MYDDGAVIDPGNVGLLSYAHPIVQQVINDINTGTLSVQLFLTLLEQQEGLLLQQSSANKTGFFYDGCVVVAVVDWRQNFILSIGSNSSSTAASANAAGQPWIRRTSFFNGGSKSNNSHTALSTTSKLPPETHKVLLKPTQECWQHAIHFLSQSSAEGEALKRVIGDQDALLEFERLMLLVDEPLVCLNPSPAVMLAMNALHYDRFKMRSAASVIPTTELLEEVLEEMERTLANLSAMKRTAVSNVTLSSPNSPTLSSGTSPSTRFKRISSIEAWRERETRRKTEPIYGIDHRRQFVKNRSALPPSSFIPPNWRPFRTIRYEREIVIGSPAGSPRDKKDQSVISSSLAKLFYCVNVFYAPPPTFPPIQLFLQVGTLQDTSTNGFMHRLQFSNLAETEAYLQNLRNLLLIENGNCNLKVITDISTTNTNGPSASNGTATTVPPNQLLQMQQMQQQMQNQQSARKPPTSAAEMFQLTPHQILQLNQKQLERK